MNDRKISIPAFALAACAPALPAGVAFVIARIPEMPDVAKGLALIPLFGAFIGAVPWAVFGLPALALTIRRVGPRQWALVAAALLAVALPFGAMMVLGSVLGIADWRHNALLNLYYGLPLAALWSAIFGAVYRAAAPLFPAKEAP